ncbi:glycosyltransferase [Williamsia muralis]|uniref:glycosyltransferase n=1 Tax=Williamsia marianensis TaxID=85044 RepID=UPI003F188ACB
MPPQRAQRRRPSCVSVIIPVRNGMPYLIEQVKALAAQDYQGDWEVVISDNGSTDGLREFIDGPASPDGLHVVYVDSSAVPGASRARNAGAVAARGDFLAFVDSDDRVRPHWLSSMAATAEAADLVSGSLDTEALNSPQVRAWRPIPLPEDGWPVPGWYPTAIGANMGVWRDVHDRIGGFDETFVHTAEDNDYVWRAQLAGYVLVHSPEALLEYRLRSTYRSLWKQIYIYGRGAAQIHARYREMGFTQYNRPLLFPLVVTSLALRNPLLPQAVTRMNTGRWIYHVAHEAGKIRGGITHRVLCL